MKEAKLTHVVHFEVNGGSPIADQVVVDNKKVKIPEDPEKPSYYFIAWYDDPDLENKSFIEFERINKDKTYYAGWGKWVDIMADAKNSFDENGKKIAPLASRSGYVYVNGHGARMMALPFLAKTTTFTAKPEPGFHFVAWYKRGDDDSIGELMSTDTSFSFVLENDIKCYAIFEED